MYQRRDGILFLGGVRIGLKKSLAYQLWLAGMEFPTLLGSKTCFHKAWKDLLIADQKISLFCINQHVFVSVYVNVK